MPRIAPKEDEMQGTRFYEVAAAAIPVVFLALVVEFRRIKTLFDIGGWGLGASLLWLLQGGSLLMYEIASLAQLAYRPRDPYTLANPTSIIVAVGGVMVILVFAGALELFAPTKAALEQFQAKTLEYAEVRRRIFELRTKVGDIDRRGRTTLDLHDLSRANSLSRELEDTEAQLKEEVKALITDFFPAPVRWLFRRQFRRFDATAIANPTRRTKP